MKSRVKTWQVRRIWSQQFGALEEKIRNEKLWRRIKKRKKKETLQKQKGLPISSEDLKKKYLVFKSKNALIIHILGQAQH